MTHKQWLRIAGNLIAFLGLIALTFYILLRGQDLPQLAAVLLTVKIRYLLLAAGCMCIFLLCEAVNIRKCLHLLSCRCNFRQAIRYALTGFFFSSITPSASGGQPMQLYDMHRDHIPISSGALALLMQFCSFQTVTVCFAITGFITTHSVLAEQIGRLRYLFLLGAGLNLALLAITWIAIVSRGLTERLRRAASWFLHRLPGKKPLQLDQALTEQIALYQRSAVYFQNISVFFQLVLVTILQIGAYYSIPCWIYLSLGLPVHALWQIVALQAVLHVTVSALPLPGAVGASESGFLLLFRTVFPAAALHDAMLLSRGVSFYLFVAVSGMVFALSTLFRHKKNSETN